MWELRQGDVVDWSTIPLEVQAIQLYEDLEPQVYVYLIEELYSKNSSIDKMWRRSFVDDLDTLATYPNCYVRN